MLLKIWFVLWGLLWAVYFMLDGFDLGAGALFPFLAKKDEDRDAIHRAIGPYWDGNEVWLVAAGGITFAAFPVAYAVLFSSFYSALMLLLFMLILRGAALGLRYETESKAGKRIWDALFFVSSLLAAILLGVTFANIFRGVPINAEGIYQGSLLTLLNPYGLLGGVLFLLLFMVHGALWLAVKTGGDLSERAGRAARGLWLLLVVVAVTFLVASGYTTRLYDNYRAQPGLLVIPAALVGSLLATGLFTFRKRWLWAWVGSALTILYAAFFGLFGIYPALLPSSLGRAYDVTIENAASGPLTLKIMLGVVLVFVPLVIAYQSWVYLVFKGKVGEE